MGDGVIEKGEQDEKNELVQSSVPVHLKRVFRTQRKTIVLSILFELLIVLCFTQWGKQTDAHHSELADHHQIVELRVAYWTVFAGCIVLRAIVLLIWRVGKGHECVWAGLFMFFSSIPFIFYMAFYFRMTNRLTYPHLTDTISRHLSVGQNTDHYTETCDMPYVFGKCDGNTTVAGVNCCVIIRAQLEALSGVVPVPFEAFTLTIATAQSLLVWLTIMVMSWLWMDVPLVQFTADDKDFMANVWLDILDCAVFGAYILHPAVQNPTFGFVAEGHDVGRQCASAPDAPCSEDLHKYVWGFWLLAFFSSVLAPTVYTMLKFKNEDKASSRTIDNAIADLNHGVRLLARKKAEKHLDEALELQLQQYHDADSDDEVHAVTVKGRTGKGTMVMPEQFGSYTVTFDDGQDPKQQVAAVKELQPDLEQHKSACGKKCCHGWGNTKYLCPHRKHRLDSFERKAKFMNAFRSLFFLELPFLCVRYYFDIHLGGWVSLLFLKNLIWVIVNAMLLLSCGNENATCFAARPISTILNSIKGTKLASVFVGPTQMFTVAAQIYESHLKLGIEDQISHEEAKKAWLLVEKKKGKELGLGTEEYTAAYAEVEQKVETLIARSAAIHM